MVASKLTGYIQKQEMPKKNNNNNMYIRCGVPEEVFVKNSITKTRGFEDDKCVSKESVIGSGIKGLSCPWWEAGRRQTDWVKKKEKEMEGKEGWKEEHKQMSGGPGRETEWQWVGFDRHISHKLTALSIAPGWPPWLTASRWRMNGVVRQTVSQSHIAVATRAPAEQAHSCPRWSLGMKAGYWHGQLRKHRSC